MPVIVSSRKTFYSSAALLLFGHDEAESEGLLLGHGNVFDLAVTVSSLLLVFVDACYSAMTKPSQKAFNSPIVATSPTWP